MKCPNCQFENRSDAKFCKSCGYKLEGLNAKPEATASAASVCLSCGAVLKPGAKFCSKCGSTIAASPAPAPAPQPEPKTEILMPAPEPETQTEILMPAPAPAPVQNEPQPSSACPNCGAALKPNAKFCSKCGITLSPSAPKPSAPVPAPAPIPQPVPVPPQPVPVPPQPAPVPPQPKGIFCKNCGTPLSANAKFCPKCGYTPDGKKPKKASEKPPKNKDKNKDKKKKSKAPLIIVIILVILLLLGGGFFALSKAGLLPDLPKLKIGDTSKKDDKKDGETDANGEDGEDGENSEGGADGDSDDADAAAELEEKLAPIAEQVTAGKDKMSSNDYAGASTDLSEALKAYAALAEECEEEDVTDTISPLADTAFGLYAQSILKQVEGWESQPPTAPLHKQIEITLEDASAFAAELQAAGLAVSTDALDENFAAFPGRYKEKYIKAFNDLVAEEQWSRTTAWMYMQDAASVGLVDKSNLDDPLTLRYAYALAWSTQKEVSEGRADESLTDEEAIDAILVVIENADYNPVLMRELALCYDSVGDSSRYKTVQDACVDVRNYLANNEDIYINPADLLVPGKTSKASSTIDLKDYWYFNDFGDYSPSSTNGLSPAGRTYVRDVCKQAIDSL